MVTELFDESLELMRKTLCWSYEDIATKFLRVSPKKYPYLSYKARTMLAFWLKSNYFIYNYFVKQLQERIRQIDHTAMNKLNLYRDTLRNKCKTLMKNNEDRSCQVARFRKKITKDVTCPCQPYLFKEDCESRRNVDDLAPIVVCAQKDIYNNSYFEKMMYDTDCDRDTYGGLEPVYF